MTRNLTLFYTLFAAVGLFCGGCGGDAPPPEMNNDVRAEMQQHREQVHREESRQQSETATLP